jgi:hypothetical protein
MSADSLATGVRALEDSDVRAAVAAGDVGAAGALELTDEERGLLIGAAEELPEVAGFDFFVHKHIANIKYEDTSALGDPVKWNNALTYLEQKGFEF